MADYPVPISETVTVSEALAAGRNSVKGALLPLIGVKLTGTRANHGRKGLSLDTTFVAAGLTIVSYRLRAWNLNTNAWEIWTSDSSIGLPPSGDPFVYRSIIARWEA